MGRSLYASSRHARDVFDLADATLGLPITRLCFEGPEDSLTATENAQPALLTTCTALLAAMAAGHGQIAAFVAGRAAYVAGHSLGEYSALVAAGALAFPVALTLVRRRGELMAEAREGGMAAVLGLEEQQLEEICRAAQQTGGASGAVVVIANYNAPGQLVISGMPAALERASALAKERGARRVVPLKVSAGFHSPLMRAAAEGLRPAIAQAQFDDARLPLVANVTGEPLQSAAELRDELIAQVTAPVRWIASTEYMAAHGVDIFAEIGPGAVLTGLVKRIVPHVALRAIATLEDAEQYRSQPG
jgi:[acyl-carrier-protein] S-malonyltransferase